MTCSSHAVRAASSSANIGAESLTMQSPQKSLYRFAGLSHIRRGSIRIHNTAGPALTSATQLQRLSSGLIHKDGESHTATCS